MNFRTCRRPAAFTAVLGLATSLLVAVPVAAESTPTPTPALSSTPSPANPLDAAKAEAKKQGKQIEIPSLHTENMTTVANPDGKTVGTYVFQAPVRFKDGTGNWRAIDTTLVQDGGVIKPKALKDEVRLSVGGDTGLLKVKTAEAEARLGAVRNLPAPTLAGNTATYTDAYGKGIDLLLEVGLAGVRQKVVIKQRPTGQLTLRVPVDPGDGLKYRSKSGQAEVLDDGKKIADIFPAVLVDATAAESAATGKIGHATAEFDGDDLVYRPDAAFLTDPATTYPVTLLANPTPWYGAGYPSDTFVSNDSRFTVGGAQQYMDAILAGRNNYDGESSYYIYRSYLKYNLTEAPWYGRPILNADLRPWNYITTHCGGDENTPKMAVRRVTSNWELNGSSSVNLRWDRQPSVTTTGEEVKGGGVGRIRKAGGTYVYCSQPAQELYYSIEDIVTAWATGSPNYGLQLAAYGDSGGTSNFREYLSTEWAGIDGRGPVLFVEYDAPSPKQAKGIFIPYEDNPTVGDDRDSTFTSDTAPVADALTEAEALKQIEAAPDYVMEDSALALGVPEDMTAEEWLESIEAVHETPGDPPDPEPGPDTTPPTVAGTYPEPDSTGVPYATTIRAGFNEEVSEARIEVKDPAGTTVTGNTAMDETNKVLSFQPAQPLLAETVYTAEVSGARDAAGNTMISPYRWSFATAEADRTPPAVTSTIPENGATQVIVSEPVIASFSEPVKDAQITLKAPGGASVAGTAGMDAERRTLTFSPAQVLAAGTTYTVEVSGAKDEAGNVMAPHTWSFTTGANCAAPIVSDLQVRPSTSRGSITTTSTLTPELLARVVEDHGCASTLEVQVEHDPDYGEETGLIWSGSTSGVASGYVGAVQVPAGKLSDGQWLRWRARATAGGASGPWSDWQLLNVDVSKPVVAELSVEPSTTWFGGTTTSSLTPRLKARVSDPESRPSTLEVQVEHDPDYGEETGLIWSGSTANVPSGQVGTVQVPTEKLSDGQWLRWRARATAGGASGPWSDWQLLNVDLSSSPAKSRSEASDAQLAARRFPYEHVTPEECRTEVGKINNPDYVGSLHKRAWHSKNSYSLCYATWIGERDEDSQVDRNVPLFSDANWWARMTVTFHTYVGMSQKAANPTRARNGPSGMNSRQIGVRITIDEINVQASNWEKRTFKIGLGETGCKATFVDTDGVTKPLGDGKETTVDRWRGNPVFDIVLSVPENSMSTSPDKGNTCSIYPGIKYTQNPELPDNYQVLNPDYQGKKWNPTFLCDSADWIKAYTGGCILGTIRPVFVLDGNQKKVEQSAAHWLKALYEPGNTDPDKGTAKLIPGRFDWANPGCDGPGGALCLHRTRNQTTINNNRAVSIPKCRQLWPGYSGHCDEFPFASTLEGAANPKYDYSIKTIKASDNCSSGSRTSVFYQRHRIRDNFPFWVNIIPKGQTKPVGEAPGIVVTDPTPEELPELGTTVCTIDGLGAYALGPEPQ